MGIVLKVSGFAAYYREKGRWKHPFIAAASYSGENLLRDDYMNDRHKTISFL